MKMFYNYGELSYDNIRKELTEKQREVFEYSAKGLYYLNTLGVDNKIIITHKGNTFYMLLRVSCPLNNYNLDYRINVDIQCNKLYVDTVYEMLFTKTGDVAHDCILFKNPIDFPLSLTYYKNMFDHIVTLIEKEDIVK